MEPLKYLDFELKFERQGEGYLARVLRSPGGEASNSFMLPFSEDKLELLVLKVGQVRRGTRRIHSTEMEAARELGGKLFETVFGPEVRACFKSSLDEANRLPATGLRLKLRLQDTPELSDLPWEFLFDSSFDRFLAQSDYTPVVRYIELPERIQPLAVGLPLRVLVMTSSPANYPRLDVHREKFNMETALARLKSRNLLQLEWLEEATLRALQQRLREHEYHVFHFIGHGGLDARTGEGVLVMQDERGDGWLAGAHRVGTVLHDCRSLRLAVLNSCEGARNTRADPFAGVATTLLRQGIPAGVAMQFEITDEAAIIFSSELYGALASGLPIDASLAEARKAIYLQPNDVEWGTPVLYMRSPDGVLFNLSQVVATEKEAVTEPRQMEFSEAHETASRARPQPQAPVSEQKEPTEPLREGPRPVAPVVPQAPNEAPQPFSQRHRVKLVAGGAATLIAVIIGIWLSIAPQHPQPPPPKASQAGGAQTVSLPPQTTTPTPTPSAPTEKASPRHEKPAAAVAPAKPPPAESQVARQQLTTPKAGSEVKSVTVAPKQAFLNINTSPSGAKIYVDGALSGTSPVVMRVSLGSHLVRATMEGYHDWETSVALEEPREYKMNAPLKEARASRKPAGDWSIGEVKDRPVK